MATESTATELTAAARGVSRRGFITRCAAAPAVVAVTGGIVAAAAEARVKIYKGRYAIDSHRIIDGYFASPRGRDQLDVVLIVPQSGALDAATEAMARRYAADGYMAIAPNLPTSYRAASLAGKPAMVAALLRDVPRLKRLTRGSGKVAVVAA